MTKKIICAALAAVLTVCASFFPAFAAEAEASPSGMKGTIKFDPGDWNSSRIQFYICEYTETYIDEPPDDTVRYATKDGWTEDDPWGLDEKIGGTKLDDGTFESFGFEIPEGHKAYITFYDPDAEFQTYELAITPEAFSDTARLLPIVPDDDFPDYIPDVRDAKFGNYTLPPDCDNEGNVIGSIFFDPGEWNSSRIQFYIWDSTGSTTMYAKMA